MNNDKDRSIWGGLFSIPQAWKALSGPKRAFATGCFMILSCDIACHCPHESRT